MIGNLLKKNKEITHVYLDPEIDYVSSIILNARKTMTFGVELI